jgi:hypothetical protein
MSFETPVNINEEYFPQVPECRHGDECFYFQQGNCRYGHSNTSQFLTAEIQSGRANQRWSDVDSDDENNAPLG